MRRDVVSALEDGDTPHTLDSASARKVSVQETLRSSEWIFLDLREIAESLNERPIVLPSK